MDNSDDYFDDTLVLDENDLAILQQEEEKYTLNLTQLPVQELPPPLKRQKTSHEETPRPRLQTVPSDVPDVLEETPEVYLREDGTYGVRGELRSTVSVAGTRSTGTGDPESRNFAHVIPRTRPLSVPHPSNIRNPPSRPASDGQLRPDVHQLPSSRTHTRVTRKPTLTPAPVSKPSAETGRPFIRNLSRGVANSRSPPPTLVPPNDASYPSQAISGSNHAGPSETQLQREVAALRAQLEELNKANLDAHQSLKEAQEARYAKEGEVTILRKGIEKVTLDHAADVAQLKASREAVEAKQIQMQKDMKEEMERLRTQFIFKQHEVETSIRKPTWSVRSKRLGQGAPPTPIPIPLAMRTWSSHNSAADPMTSTHVKDTPTRTRVVREAHPTSPRNAKRRPALIEPAFPGFENSFFSSSPGKSPVARKVKPAEQDRDNESPRPRHLNTGGKGKEREEEPTSPEFTSRTRNSVLLPLSLRQTPSRSPRKREQMLDVEMTDVHPSKRSDVRGSSPVVASDLGDMSFGVDTEMGELDGDPEEEYEDFQGINWRDELHRMLFTHTSKSSTALTFHCLLSTSLPPTVSHSLRGTYQTACTTILEAIGTRDSYVALDEFMSVIATALLKLTRILVEAQCLKPLMAALDLFTSLILFIPSFTSVLLEADTPEDGSPSALLAILCDVIRDYLQLPKDGGQAANVDERSDLAGVTMALLDAVCWTTPANLVEKLTILIRKDRTLMTLLSHRQPPLLIASAVRLLVILASHLPLFRSLLSFPDPDIPVEPDPPKDYSRIPLIERLCSFFIDPTPLASEAEQSLSLILNFIALLSIAHPEGMPNLLESDSLIPSLVHYLTYLTTLIWEDDESVVASASTASMTVRVIIQTLHLLHHLVFTPKPTYNLRQKLHNASHRHFNGLMHMFIVMMGRLSYADPPEWLAAELKAEIEQIVELARDLMDLIVEGPEGDSVWVAYQGGDEQADVMEEDDEEMEARGLDANEIE